MIKIGREEVIDIRIGKEQVDAVAIGKDIVWENEPDTFDYDYVSTENVDEVDILYTADTHLCWNGSGTSAYHVDPVFKLNDIADYKDKLWDAGIPTFCVDAGDWVHGTGGTTQINQIINLFNNLGSKGYNKYLAVTYGNHEWYESVNGSNGYVTKNYLDRVNNLTACNLMDVNYNRLYKGWRAVKIGNKKIGIIGIGYPSPNGGRSYNAEVLAKLTQGGGARWTLDEDFRWYDSTWGTAPNARSTELDPSQWDDTIQKNGTAVDLSSVSLYSTVQEIIDMFKANNFDYIIAVTHMDTYADEDWYDDSRFISRADFLIKNTSGLDLVIPGHKNEPTTAVVVKDKSGNNVKIVEECGASFHNIGRIRLKFDGSSPISYLLDERSDLDNINVNS